MEQVEPTTQKKTIISSGNAELDSRMGGGLPIGTLALIEGNSGSGKSVLSQQITWGALQDGFIASVFTSENTVRSLVTQMRSLDLDILNYLLLGRLQIYPMALSRLGAEASSKLLRSMQREVQPLRPATPTARPSRKHFKPDLLVIDSVTSAIQNATSEADIVHFFEACKTICATGTTILLTMHTHVGGGDSHLFGLIRSMCDADLFLSAEEDGQRMVKMLRVVKIRGAASSTGSVVGFDVEPGWGMRVIPISKARG